jgi:hypothetical protein
MVFIVHTGGGRDQMSWLEAILAFLGVVLFVFTVATIPLLSILEVRHPYSFWLQAKESLRIQICALGKIAAVIAVGVAVYLVEQGFEALLAMSLQMIAAVVLVGVAAIVVQLLSGMPRL